MNTFRIALALLPSVDHDIDGNIKRMEELVISAKKEECDLVIIGEAYLQGFRALTFDYEHDMSVAAGASGVEIACVRSMAKRYKIGLGIGFYENDAGALYSAYMVVNSEGAVLSHGRCLTPTWKTAKANAEYREGHTLQTFTISNWTCSVLIGGDLWSDEWLTSICDLDSKVDAFIWPANCGCKIDEWEGRLIEEYVTRSALLAKPVLFVNNMRDRDDQAIAGAYIWSRGKTISELISDREGFLVYQMEK